MEKPKENNVGKSQLDDTIKFSLPSLVALGADNLFTAEVDRRCCRSYMEDLMTQLQLDDSTRKVIQAFLKRSTASPTNAQNNNPHIEPLVSSIRSKLWISKSAPPTDGSEEAVTKQQEPLPDEEKPPSDSDSKSTFYLMTSDSAGSIKVADEAQEDNAIGNVSPSPLNSTLNEELAIAIISCLIVTALVRGRYDARIRTIVRYVIHKLRLKWDLVEDVEDSLVEHFREAKVVQSEEENKEIEKAHKLAKIKRIAAISVATVIGGVVIGVTGGLAAPAVVGAIGGLAAAGGFGAFLASTAGAAVIGSLFGAVGAGLTGYKMNRRIGDVEEFEFVPLTDGQQLHLAIALPGWLSSIQPDCRTAYYTLSIAREQYCLKFESRYLIELGNALDYFLNIATSSATSNVASEIAKQSALGTFYLATAWPQLLLSAANVIDNPWGICLRRSAKAGEQLAEVLLKRQQGHRPVTLIGYSLGARAVFYCLKAMSRDKYAACSGGIIQNVILLGAPVSASPQDWSQFSRVVSGEIINGYSRTDWLLKFLYRTTSVKAKIAGLMPVEWNDRRMFNIDLSHIVSGHGDYLHKMDMVLSELGIGDRRKATLMSLADTRRHLAASASLSQMSNKTGEGPRRSATSSLAAEQLQLAEKMMAARSLNDDNNNNNNNNSNTPDTISFDEPESAHEAESLNDDVVIINNPPSPTDDGKK